MKAEVLDQKFDDGEEVLQYFDLNSVKKIKIYELLKNKRSEILSIANQHGAYNIRVFGSVARGEETEQSDIDFLVDYDLDKITPWFPMGLIEDLEALLGKKVDLVTAKSLHYFIRDKIMNEAISL
jgi:predicted nucleotidyltransferase